METFEQAQNLIRDHIDDPRFSLERASRLLFLSERSLQRVLAREGSLGFRHELWRARMQRAEDLLRAGMRSSEVACRVGYQRPEHFAKAFRRWSGLSPGSWLAAQAS